MACAGMETSLKMSHCSMCVRSVMPFTMSKVTVSEEATMWRRLGGGGESERC